MLTGHLLSVGTSGKLGGEESKIRVSERRKEEVKDVERIGGAEAKRPAYKSIAQRGEGKQVLWG